MKNLSVFLAAAVVMLAYRGAIAGGPDMWRMEWPNTDFSRHSVDFAEIMSGGPPKDGIPAIDDPQFARAGSGDVDLSDQEPVIALDYQGEARAYPLRILMYHEIVNDRIGDRWVAVTYCPLCNASIVFNRELAGRVLDFGTTGKLRNSDLVMYDRQTESWWQQFTGSAIIGEMTGNHLELIPSRVVPFEVFVAAFPDGMVLLPPRSYGSYGTNPYAGYDGSDWPFLYRGDYAGNLAPLAYVLAVGEEAWSLALLQREGRLETGELVITWRPGMTSALDEQWIPNGFDLGYVDVRSLDGEAIAHDMTFAFAFLAFHPNGVVHE